MRVMFSVFPQPGHLFPFLGIAQHLEAHHHTVGFFCSEEITPILRKAGLKAHCFTISQRVPPGPKLKSAVFAQRLRNPKWAETCYAHIFLRQLAQHVEALNAAVEEFKADVVGTDPVLYAGPIVATRKDIPWAGICATLVPLSPTRFRSIYHDAMESLTEERNTLFRSFGVKADFKFGETVSPWYNSVFTTEEFCPRISADNSFSHYVGPPSVLSSRGDTPEFPWQRLDSKLPLIYVSFGTQLSPPRSVFDAVIKSKLRKDAQLVIALNDWADDSTISVPPVNTIAVPYAPQLALMERADAVLIHGGANTVAEALKQGIPMLVAPLGHEQSLQAHLVEIHGSGRRIDIDGITAEAIGDELSTLIENTSFRERATKAQSSFRKTDSSKLVADSLIQLAQSRSPIEVSI